MRQPKSRPKRMRTSLPKILFKLFVFIATVTTSIYTLSLHDALPICTISRGLDAFLPLVPGLPGGRVLHRSEEHTSELQSHSDLVCRLLLEKKKLSLISLFVVTASNTMSGEYSQTCSRRVINS